MPPKLLPPPVGAPSAAVPNVSGPAAITELFTFVPVPAHYQYYKKIVLDKYILRQLIHACSLTIHQAYEHGKEQLDDDVSTLIDHSEQRVLAVRDRSLHAIFGAPDDLKFRSCMTLFAHAAPDAPLFREALDRFCDGLEDPATVAALSPPGCSPRG